MEGESRKRKMEKDEDEEEKIELFFALVRSTRDVRERMIGGANKSQEEEEKKKNNGEEEKLIGVLNPSFQPENFMEGGGGDKSNFPQASPDAGLSKTEEATRKEEDKEGGGCDHGLDLKLSL